MIYCLTQHHTGTWSTLAWILRHREVEGFLTTEHIFDILEPSSNFPVHPMESGDLVEEFHPSMVYHEHLRFDSMWEENLRIDRSQVLIASVTRTVIPIRDPLATLISYQFRAERAGRTPETGFAPLSHVDSWVLLAQTSRHVLKRFAHIKFIPWDLLVDALKTTKYLLGIAENLGLKDREPSFEFAEKMIRNNDAGTYGLKQAYQEKDFGKIKNGVSQGAVEYLISKRDLIKPFLEFLGYKDLMWWT